MLRAEEGRMGVLVTFLALLELCKEQLIWILQAEPLGPIHFALASQGKGRSMSIYTERGAAPGRGPGRSTVALPAER